MKDVICDLPFGARLIMSSSTIEGRIANLTQPTISGSPLRPDNLMNLCGNTWRGRSNSSLIQQTSAPLSINAGMDGN